MSNPAQPRMEGLIQMLDLASQCSRERDTVDHVKNGLEDLIAAHGIELPKVVWEVQESYARRLLYRSPTHGYEVIAMTWGPGQGTPLHDHAGIWCVDGVIAGVVEVTQYDLVSEEGERCLFQPRSTVEAGVGSAGSLIPPFEYHTITNPSGTATSITLHVYGGHMGQCTLFEHVGGGWYRRCTRDLAYT